MSCRRTPATLTLLHTATEERRGQADSEDSEDRQWGQTVGTRGAGGVVSWCWAVITGVMGGVDGGSGGVGAGG